MCIRSHHLASEPGQGGHKCSRICQSEGWQCFLGNAWWCEASTPKQGDLLLRRFFYITAAMSLPRVPHRWAEGPPLAQDLKLRNRMACVLQIVPCPALYLTIFQTSRISNGHLEDHCLYPASLAYKHEIVFMSGRFAARQSCSDQQTSGPFATGKSQ